MDIEIKQLDPELPMPSFAHPGDAGLDLHSAIDLALEPMQRATVPCGFAVAIPEGFAGFVLPRSGLAAKHGITVVNSPGLIDSGYRGEIKVVLMNTDQTETFHIERGSRIAQLVIMRTPEVSLISVNELDDTERSAGGFGSSGI